MCTVDTTMNRMSSAKRIELFYNEQDNIMIKIITLKFEKRIFKWESTKGNL